MLYMRSKKIKPVYLSLTKDLSVERTYIDVDDVLGLKQNDGPCRYEFEVPFRAFEYMSKTGIVPSADCIVGQGNGQVRPFENKITVTPDMAAYSRGGDGCELIIRPDTIVYMVFGICDSLNNEKINSSPYFTPLDGVDWDNPVRDIHLVQQTMDAFLQSQCSLQIPFLIQVIWDTHGTTTNLKTGMDVFVWSNLALTNLFMRKRPSKKVGISRPTRSMIWMAKMLCEGANSQQIDVGNVINTLIYGPKNDKSFSVNGKLINDVIQSDELTNPRIRYESLREIIIGDAVNRLRPERRLDAAIVANASKIFE
jgi:hypothetical protein